MTIWSAEIKEIKKLYESHKGQLPKLEKELVQLISTEDANVILLYSRRCLKVIITDLCECELIRSRGTEPLKGIIDKLFKEKKVPAHIITSMHGLNDLSTYGTHPKDFDPEQVKPVLNNLSTIIKWYLKYKDNGSDIKSKPTEDIRQTTKITGDIKKDITISRKRLAGILGGLIGIIASVFAVLYFSNIIGSGKQIKESEKSIAVLPFKSLSDDPNNQYLADGIMDAILLHLSKIKDLRVLPRTSVEQYRGTTKVAHDIGQELDVEYLLEGSFQKFDDNARLIVQLIRAKKESHIWADEYNSKWSEIFSIQSGVAQTIAKELYASITPAEKRLIEKVPTAILAAYDLYLKANNYKNDYQKARNISSYQNAATFYKAALAIDSTFAKAYTGLASAYYNRYQWETYFKENYLDSMRVLSDMALSYDDQLDEAYYLKGRYHEENGQIEEAMDNYDKALKINPNYYSAYVARGGTWISTDFVNSITNYQQALNLIRGDERPALLQNLALVYHNVGFFDKAKYLFKDALQLDGDSVSYFDGLSRLEFAMEDFENAILFSEKASKIDTTFIPDFVWYSFAGRHQQAYIIANKEVEKLKKNGELPLGYSHRIGYAFDKVGKDKEAKFYYNQQIKYGEDCINLSRANALNKTAHYDLAGVYAYLGDKTKAYHYLDEVDQLNIFPSWWISYAKHDPLFDKIRNEERFQQILRNMEAKYQAEHERVNKWLEENGML